MSKYIDVDKAIEVCDWYEHEYSECEDYIRTIAEDIRHLPAADVAEVVLCKDCKYTDLFYPYCTIWEAAIDGDGYCYKGEKDE